MLIVKKIPKYKNIFIITFEVELIIPIKEDTLLYEIIPYSIFNSINLVNGHLVLGTLLGGEGISINKKDNLSYWGSLFGGNSLKLKFTCAHYCFKTLYA